MMKSGMEVSIENIRNRKELLWWSDLGLSRTGTRAKRERGTVTKFIEVEAKLTVSLKSSISHVDAQCDVSPGSSWRWCCVM